ncbi:MAG: hypothetical protein ACJ0BO_00510 [Candidatus Puniceispirillaceae bacterium]
MANPNLKAKIEAAKSALQEGQNNPPPNQEREDSITPNTIFKTTPDTEPTSPSTADEPTNSEPDGATLDARITRLESKLAENQRDLHTLLGKIREITRLQNDATNNTATSNTTPKDISSDRQNAGGHRGRRIALTLAVLTGIIFGAGFFFASDFIDSHLVQLRTWTMQFVDFVNSIAG